MRLAKYTRQGRADLGEQASKGRLQRLGLGVDGDGSPLNLPCRLADLGNPLETYGNQPAFSYSASLNEIQDAGYALTPGRFVGAVDALTDGEDLDRRIAQLSGRLLEQIAESQRLSTIVRDQIGIVE